MLKVVLASIWWDFQNLEFDNKTSILFPKSVILNLNRFLSKKKIIFIEKRRSNQPKFHFSKPKIQKNHYFESVPKPNENVFCFNMTKKYDAKYFIKSRASESGRSFIKWTVSIIEWFVGKVNGPKDKSGRFKGLK